MKRRWFGIIGVGVLAVFGATTAIALANPADPADPPTSNPGFPSMGDPKAQPGYPAASNHGYRHDPHEIGPCGVRWGDIYVDENGLVGIVDGDGNDDCHVMTKGEVERSRQMQREHPWGPSGPPTPGQGQESAPTTSTP